MMNAGIAQVQVKADTYDPQATVTINGEAGANQSVDLSYGENLITVVVSAQGATSTTYTVTIRRPPVVQLEGAGAGGPSPAAAASGAAQLAQSFAGWRTSYTVEVPREVIGLRVLPTITTPKTATINGKPSNVNANTYVSLQRGKTNNISIVVTQGANSTTYTVAVTVEGGNSTPTVASALADISGLEPDDTGERVAGRRVHRRRQRPTDRHRRVLGHRGGDGVGGFRWSEPDRDRRQGRHRDDHRDR